MSGGTDDFYERMMFPMAGHDHNKLKTAGGAPRFADAVKDETPRIVVQFHRPAPDQERWQWGLVGAVPILTAIGYISRVQREVALYDSDHACPQQALVIAWDESAKRFDYFVHPDIPVDSLVGMLETIKAALVDSQLALGTQNDDGYVLSGTWQPARKVIGG